MRVIADIQLAASERRYLLPASGTRSMLFKFGDAVFAGDAHCESAESFSPGGEYEAVDLRLWGDDAEKVVSVGSQFSVLYGPPIGSGVVTQVSRNA